MQLNLRSCFIYFEIIHIHASLILKHLFYMTCEKCLQYAQGKGVLDITGGASAGSIIMGLSVCWVCSSELKVG